MKYPGQKMSWYIVTCAALLTVSIFCNGQTSGEVGEAIQEFVINIPDTDGSESESVIELSDFNFTLNDTPLSEADVAHSRHVRSAGMRMDANNGTKEDSPMEILTRILAILESFKKNMTAEDLLMKFWCRINVTKMSDIDEKVLMEAVNMMSEDVKTCPLGKENALVKQIAKLWAQQKIPTAKEIIVILNATMYQLLSPTDIAKMKNSSEGIIFIVLEKMVSYFEKKPKNSIFHMLGGLLCSIDKVDITELSEKTLMDIINSIDKTTCSVQQQKVILEKFVQMFSIRRWLDPKNIFGFLDSDIFKVFTKTIGIQDKQMLAFLAGSMLEKIKIFDWTMLDFGERILCHLDKTNITEIDDKVIGATLLKLMVKPDCSKDELKKKWMELITSSGHLMKGLLLQNITAVEKGFNEMPMMVVAELKKINWTEIKIEIFKVVKEINGFADKVIKNVVSSKAKKWTLKGLYNSVVCGLNITDFTKLDDKFLGKMLDNLGKLDVCSEAEQNAAFDNYLQAAADVNSMNIMMGLKEINDSIKFSDIFKYIKDEHIESIKNIISMLKIKGLDALIGTVWSSMKKNADQELGVDYILRFLACNVKTSEITKLNLETLMKIATKFGLPVTCKTPSSKVWLTDFLKLMMKIPSDMGFEQLDKLDKAIGGFTTKDLKDIANKAKMLKDLAMASLNKFDKKSDEWITFMENNGTVDISTIGRHLVCFFMKANFSSIETSIVSLGEFGQCTKDESIKMTKDFLNGLTKMDEGVLLKDFLIGLGILSGKFNVTQMEGFITKVTGILNVYIEKIWSMVPKELKELTVAKVLMMISKEIAPLDELLTCVVKSVAWPAFGQPNAPDFLGCFIKYTSGGPGKKPGEKPGVKPGVKPGDFPFPKLLAAKADMDMLINTLLYFTREPISKKEERVLYFVTKKVIEYLLANPKKLEAKLPTNKKRIIELASKVNLGSQIISKMKVDSESLAVVKISTPQQARKLLKRALVDIKLVTAKEKKDFLQKLPTDVMMQSGTELIDSFYSEATKLVFIKSFTRKKKPKTSKKKNEDDEEEEEQSLAKLNLMNKLTNKTLDNATLILMMDTSLISAISINLMKTLPQKEMCSMKADITQLKDDQVQLFVNSCPQAMAKIAKNNATSLGKLATKVTKKIVDSLKLKELISLTEEACRYERKLDIDLGKVFKDHYTTEKLDPMKNGPNMFCVLKYVTTDLPWEKPEAIEICKTLGRSIMKKIPQKRADFFKSKCMNLLMKGNITFADMGSMNAYLKKADIESLKAETILQGAAELADYVWDYIVFMEIGKKISSLTSFKKRSNLTTDQVGQVGIFIGTWSDADTIPKESVMQAFSSIATSANQLQRKKLKCLKEGQEKSKCNAVDNTIAKIVQILLKATTSTKSRRKRSTAECRCSNLVDLGMAAVQVPATQMAGMICDTNFNECIEGLSQITDWNQEHRKVFVQKATKVWGQPKVWNASNVAIASAVIPGLSPAEIKVLPLDSMDATFYLGKQNKWGMQELMETFLLFLERLKSNNVSSITSFDLQALGNIVCGISPENIKLIPKLSYINAASQIGSLEICSQAQLTAWAKKALEVYGTDVNKWGLAEISSIGSVISGFSVMDLQKLNEKQLSAISVKTIPKILPEKLAALHPAQIGYLTTSQVQMVTSAQKAKMTQEQKDILNKKVLESDVSDKGKNGGPTFKVSSYFQWSLQLIIYGISVWILN